MRNLTRYTSVIALLLALSGAAHGAAILRQEKKADFRPASDGASNGLNPDDDDGLQELAKKKKKKKKKKKSSAS